MCEFIYLYINIYILFVCSHPDSEVVAHYARELIRIYPCLADKDPSYTGHVSAC